MSKPESEYKQSPEPPDSDVRETGAPVRRRRSRQPHTETSVNMDELRELIGLIQENGFAEFELEREGFRIHVRRDLAQSETSTDSAGTQTVGAASVSPANVTGSGARASATPDHPGARAETAASEDQDLHMIPSPIVGTFYRSASPNSDPFVKIYVENGQPVEYGQPLFGIKK